MDGDMLPVLPRWVAKAKQTVIKFWLPLQAYEMLFQMNKQADNLLTKQK